VVLYSLQTQSRAMIVFYYFTPVNLKWQQQSPQEPQGPQAQPKQKEITGPQSQKARRLFPLEIRSKPTALGGCCPRECVTSTLSLLCSYCNIFISNRQQHFLHNIRHFKSSVSFSLSTTLPVETMPSLVCTSRILQVGQLLCCFEIGKNRFVLQCGQRIE